MSATRSAADGHGVPGAAAPCDVLFYVQHLLGIGHLRRAALIARALDAAGMTVTLVSGGLPLPGLDAGGARIVQLPPLRSRDESFSALVDAEGREIDEAWRARRRDLLLEIYRAARPRVLMIEQFPFGRRMLRFELLPLLEAAAADRAAGGMPHILCSLRDILTTHKQPEKTAWMLEQFERYFDRLIVHGDPGLAPLTRSFPAAERIAGRTVYSGYVVDRLPPRDPEAATAGEILVSAGGGAVAAPLVEAALAAQPICRTRDPRLAAVPWRVLIGHNLEEARFRDLAARAPAGLHVERARPDFLALLARARLSISQAGYNTLLEVLGLGVPAVVVPFAAAGETEQSLRARLLAESGLVAVVPEAALTPARLADAVLERLDGAASDRRHSPAIAACDNAVTLRCDGAAATARLVGEMLASAPAEGVRCRGR